MAAFDVVGLGEISLDRLHRVRQTPGGSVRPVAPRARVLPGGQVATAMLGCARLGLRSALIGAVGDDAAAESALRPLRKAGVDVSGVRVRAGAFTRTAEIQVHAETGERRVQGHRDPRLALQPAELSASEIERGRVLHLDARDPDASVWAAGVARRVGIPVVLDADRPDAALARLLERVDFSIVSGTLAEHLGGTGSLRDGLAALRAHGAALAVATLGERGALASGPHGEVWVPAFRIRTRDTTGAGDAFRAGFIWALLQGSNVEPALHAASACAALNCEAVGAQGSLPDARRLERLLATGQRVPWIDPGTEA